MIADFEKEYAREVLPVLARRVADGSLHDLDVVEGHLMGRQLQTRMLAVLGVIVAVAILTAFAVAFSDGPLQPPGGTGRLSY